MSITKGPWFANKIKKYVGPKSQEDDQSRGMIIPICDVYGDNAEDDMQAISAVPEMMEALESIISRVDSLDVEYESKFGHKFERGEESLKQIEKAKQALAKAKGEGDE